eukprot:scaffold13933_cov95-Isochrysis_galbana.AAC.3
MTSECLPSGGTVHGHPVAAAVVPCTACFASASQSKAQVLGRPDADGGVFIRIDSVSEQCQPKAGDGDVWQVDFVDQHNSTVLQLWRSVARSLGNGSYVAPVPQEALILAGGQLRAVVALTWSTDDPQFLETSWTQRSTYHQFYAGTLAAFRPCAGPPVRPDGLALWPKWANQSGTHGAILCPPDPHNVSYPSSSDRMRCYNTRLGSAAGLLVRESAGAQDARGSDSTGRLGPAREIPGGRPSWRERRFCGSGSPGRWVSAAGCSSPRVGARACGGRRAIPLNDSSWAAWVPWGCDSRPRCDGGGIRACLGSRRLLFLGDSVSVGTFLDLCAALGGGAACGSARDPASVLQLLQSHETRIIFVPLFGIPPREGLANLFGKVMPGLLVGWSALPAAGLVC